MAETITKINKETTWVCGGTSDILTCDDVVEQIRNGVQIDANGFNLEDATIKITMANGAEKTPIIAAGTGETVIVGFRFSMSKVSISGVAAGTYVVTFSQ